MARLRRPKRREPDLPPWGNTECGKCAGPVRWVWLSTTETLDVCMKPAPLTDRRATVAAIPLNNRLEGKLRKPGTAPEAGYTLWIPHEAVCPEVPRPEQLVIPIEQESTP